MNLFNSDFMKVSGKTGSVSVLDFLAGEFVVQNMLMLPMVVMAYLVAGAIYTPVASGRMFLYKDLDRATIISENPCPVWYLRRVRGIADGGDGRSLHPVHRALRLRFRHTAAGRRCGHRFGCGLHRRHPVRRCGDYTGGGRPCHPVLDRQYESADHTVHLDVKVDEDTVWLNRKQLALLFGRDIKTIGKHVGNALREELNGFSVVAKFATTASDGKTYQVEHYNLDMILSVGYRVKSKEGIYSRRWANSVLKQHLVDGYIINRKRLDALHAVVKVLSRSTEPEIAGTAEILERYLPSLVLLNDYDTGNVPIPKGDESQWVLTYEDAMLFIRSMPFYTQSDLFGRERNGSFQGIVAGLYQTFGGEELYRSTQEKAANLLYQVVKDHPFSDGNKRCAAALFVYFLNGNSILGDDDSTACGG